MSAYPSLLSPLMNSSGLILSTALNTEAQTALASGVAANAKSDTLLATALQTSGQNYTGLPAAGITLRDASSNSIIQLDASSGKITSTSIQTGDISCNILNYTSLNPAIPPSSTPSLNQVLSVGGDASGQNISNVGTLRSSIIQSTNSSGTALSKFNNFEIYSDDGLTRTATVNAAGNFNCQNFYLYGVNPSDFAIKSNKDILTKGGITSNNLITGDISCNVLNYQSLNPAISTSTLSQVLTAGNTASADINMNASYKIYNALELRGTTINATTQVITPLLTNLGAGIVKLGTDLDGNTFSIRNFNSIASNSMSTDVLEVDKQRVKPVVKPSYTYYVSKGGSDSGSTGTLSDPYLTIGRAIQVCEAAYDGTPRVINVLAGTYTENLTLSKSRISIIGAGSSSHPDVGSAIYGTITVDISSGNTDLNNNNIYIQGFLINGVVEDITSGSSYPHRVFFTNCYLYSSNRVLYMHPAGDYRLFVSSCTISNDDTSATDPLIECYSSSTGMITFNQNKITSKGSAQNVFKLSGSCRVDIFAQNILTSDSASTGSNAIAIFQHASSSTISLGNNAFIYSTANAKLNANTACGVNMASGSGSLVIVNNFFSLSGVSQLEKAVLNSGSGVVIFGNNVSSSSAAGLSAYTIAGTLNVSKFAMTAVI